MTIREPMEAREAAAVTASNKKARQGSKCDSTNGVKLHGSTSHRSNTILGEKTASMQLIAGSPARSCAMVPSRVKANENDFEGEIVKTLTTD